MRRTRGLDCKVSRDGAGGLVSVDWHCPYCGEYNAGFYFIDRDVDKLDAAFEIDHKCDQCEKMVTIECPDFEPLF